MTESAAPIRDSDRIVALDVLRGFALMGILIMNVQAFSMPSAAYTNPSAYGDLTGLNRAVWIASHLIADQKLMSIFSMLFGAGVCLFADRAQAKTGGSAKLYYRRTFVLLLFGFAHGYLLFLGDILVAYALCGAWVYLLRNRRPRTQVVVALVLLMVPTALTVMISGAVPKLPPDAVAGMSSGWAPSAEKLAAIVDGMRGSFLQQVITRAPATITLQTIVMLLHFIWRVSGMMLLGMALYRTGVLSASKDEAWYRRVAVVGLPIGWALSAYGVYFNFSHAWVFERSMFLGTVPNYWGSIAVGFGYLSLVMIAVKRGWFAGLQSRLAAAGRMAFTNYIAQSVFAVVVFNMFGLFGATPRWQQVLFIVAVWIAQLLYSPAWLARYRFGPLEWLWRAATYGHAPPMRRST